MKRIYKYIILALAVLLFIGGVTLIIVKCSSQEEELPTPSETYYITVAKDIDTNFKGRFRRVFNDKNTAHLQAAKSYGLNPRKIDISTDIASGALQPVKTCDYYAVEELTHSHPYLVPHAKAALDELGKAFCDSLASRGGGSHRFIITSILREKEDIKRLRRRNVNSVENSAHQYGTTVDITYRRFDKYNPQFIISDIDLKMLLAEVLQDFRNAGKCYVKYEVKQGCFHITFR